MHKSACVYAHVCLQMERQREKRRKKNETERAKTVRERVRAESSGQFECPLRCLEVSSCYFERSCNPECLQAAIPSAAARQSGCRVRHSRAPAVDSGFELRQRGRSGFERLSHASQRRRNNSWGQFRATQRGRTRSQRDFKKKREPCNEYDKTKNSSNEK